MDWTLFVILLVTVQPSHSVLFTVEAEQTNYKSEFGGDVVMTCKFKPTLSDSQDNLQVNWHWVSPGKTYFRKVYQIDNGVVQSPSQEYQGRVKLFTEELKEGWVKLQVSNLRINDSGNYQCVLHTDHGADYKTISLSVTAPYKEVTKHIETAADGDAVLLTCQSEGYPKLSVEWMNGKLHRLAPNTTTVTTPSQLFKVTSQILVNSSDINNYTCNFGSGGPNATFHIPDEIPAAQVKNDGLIIMLSIALVMVVIVIAVLVYRQRQKGFNTPSTRNLLVDGLVRPGSAAACIQINKENEEEQIVFNNDRLEEDLGEVLRSHYSEHSNITEAVNVEELSHRLQNSEDQIIKLQALLPDAGEMLFLEGPAGSGKTTLAHMLVSSWAEGPTHALSHLLDLSILKLLVYFDCSTAKGDLLQEIVTQLSLMEITSAEDELRTELTRSNKVLLLLDGYKEGGQIFDESLKRFLSERVGCRVLITTCPGHCPTLKDNVRTGRMLKLQPQTVKY